MPGADIYSMINFNIANCAALFSRRGIGFALIFFTHTSFAQIPVPERMVANFHNSLVTIMRDTKNVGYKDRFKKLKPQIIKTFHLPIMLRIAVGDYWSKATLTQQNHLITIFNDISIATYTTRFSEYSGQTFQTRGSREGPRNTILVDTTLVNPGGANIPLTYVTQNINGEWGIIDVLLSTGISELAIRRSEYRRTLKLSGIRGLIDSLTAKIRDLESSN